MYDESTAVLTVESIDGLLPQSSCDAPIDPLVLVAFIIQKVFQQIQHFSHLETEDISACQLNGVDWNSSLLLLVLKVS